MNLGVTQDDLLAATRSLDRPEQVDEMAVPSYCHRNPLMRWLFWLRLRNAVSLLASRPIETAWDFGAGTGVLLPFLSRFATEHVFASDILAGPARAMVEMKSLVNVTVLGGPLPLPDEISDASVDTVVALDVLEHVEDLPGTIEIFNLKLRPGGRVVVSGPTENLAYKAGRWMAGFSGKESYHHTDISAIYSALTSAGLRAVRKKRIPIAPLPALFRLYEFSRHPD